MSDPTDPTIASLVGVGINVGAFTLVGWLVRHTFQHTIPRLASEFSAALEKSRDAFVMVLNHMREDTNNERREFLAALDKLRDDAKVDRRELLTKIDELAKTIRDARNGH